MKVYLGNTNKVQVEIKEHFEYKNIVKGFNLLGYDVVKITFPYSLSLDIDTPFYKRYNDELLDKMYKCLRNGIEIGTIIYKSGRFYIVIDDIKIILPNDMHTLCSDDNSLSIHLELKQRD